MGTSQRGAQHPITDALREIFKASKHGVGADLYLFSGLVKIAECMYFSIFHCLSFCHTDKGSTTSCLLKAHHGLCGPQCYVTRLISEGYVCKTTNTQSSG